MALKLIEGFEGFGTTTGTDVSSLVACKYTTTGKPALAAGRFSGYSMVRADSTTTYVDQSIALATDFVVGFAIKHISGIATHNIFIFTGTGGNTLAISHASAGTLTLYRNSTSLCVTSGVTWTAGQWYYIEFQFHQNATTGTCEIRVDGVTRASASSVNTDVGTISTLRLTLAATTLCLDDIYILDSSGTHNTTFLGPMRVVALYPTGDVQTDWTPSTGADHYALVDENPASTTDYVSSGYVNDKDLFSYQALADARSIAGIQINTQCHSAGNVYVATPIKSGSTTDAGTGTAVGGTEMTVTRVSETDPATSAPWELTGINAANFGVEIV
jgi:hypothetical protein